jgi:Leucine-rich repeat (LRR) protein
MKDTYYFPHDYHARHDPKLEKLRMLSLHGNKLKALPREIGSLKKLIFLNIVGNPIKEIPTDIKYLDKSNGGSLERIAVTKEDLGEKNYNLLKELLPTVIFNEMV